MQLGSFAGLVGEGVEVSALLGAEIPVLPGLAAVTWLGAQRHSDGSLDPRDAVIGAAWTPLSTDTLVLRLQPGLNLPTGGLGSELYFTPLSTASVDPYLVADAVYGASWLLGATAVGRASLYDGWDRRRQGLFGRLDVRGARRIGVTVPWLGLSIVGQGQADPVGSVPSFAELALSVGSVFNLGDRWSLTSQIRGPLWRSEQAELQLSGGLSARMVVGKASEEGGHSD